MQLNERAARSECDNDTTKANGSEDLSSKHDDDPSPSATKTVEDLKVTMDAVVQQQQQDPPEESPLSLKQSKVTFHCNCN